MSGVLIGIDVGTTFLKAAAFDSRSGKSLAHAARPLHVRAGRHGEREQSPRALDRALNAVMADLRTVLGDRWRDVAGMGLAAQGGSTIIADRQSGRALTPMFLWNDARAIRQYRDVVSRTRPAFWRRHTFRDKPGWGLAKILWLRENRPELLVPRNLYVGAGEYTYFRLTGVWRQDAGSALQVGCYNARRRALDQRLLDVVNLPVSFVAPMREGHETHVLNRTAAGRYGLPPGVPVAGPYMDHEAGYLAATGISRRPLQCSLGTAWVANFVLPQSARWTAGSQLALPSVIDDGWLIVQPLQTGNVAWDWGLERFVGPDRDSALRDAGRIFGRALLPPRGLVALPWFNAANPVEPSVIGGGVFMGMNYQTQSADFIRALASALVFEMATIVGELKRRRKVDSIVLSGGASKGAYFRRLFEAVFHPLPVYWLNETDTAGARGAVRAFGGAAVRGGARRQPVTGKELRDEVRRRYGHYLAARRQVYGRRSVSDGLAFK